ESDEGENQDRRQYRYTELGQVLSEVRLELLDTLHHRHDDVAGARACEVRRPEGSDVIVQHGPEMTLHAGGRVVGDHRPVVLQPASRDDHEGNEEEWNREGG